MVFIASNRPSSELGLAAGISRCRGHNNEQGICSIFKDRYQHEKLFLSRSNVLTYIIYSASTQNRCQRHTLFGLI